MSDHQEAKQATPPETLLVELLDSRTPKSEREHAAAREIERLTAERDEARAELERERMRLVACGVVAMSNTPESAAMNREMHADYRSESCNDVASAVDREMALRAERDALRIELDVCRSAIEDCYDIVETFDCYNDSDDACQRATLRQLNEAIGKAAPRLLYERPEGQKLYGLRYRELMAERDEARAERDALQSILRDMNGR